MHSILIFYSYLYTVLYSWNFSWLLEILKLIIFVLFCLIRELLEHGNVTFNDNGTVTAVPFHPLQFMQELSNGTEEDIVVMPNIALLVCNYFFIKIYFIFISYILFLKKD
jgi:hypothetical protein